MGILKLYLTFRGTKAQRIGNISLYKDCIQEKARPGGCNKTTKKELEIFMEKNGNIQQVNRRTAAEILQETHEILEACILEPCHDPTYWCLCGFFVKKGSQQQVEAKKARLVSEIRHLNKYLLKDRLSL